MKIALIIFRLHPSHGCILQTYALYTFLTRLGHSVTIIDKQKKISLANWSVRTKGLLVQRLRGIYHGPIFYRGIEPKEIMTKLTPFVEKHFENDLWRIYDFQELQGIENKGYDAFIVGSDQVWRPKYVPSVSYYFLDFLPDDYKTKRIAYAPSFGTDKFEYNDKQAKICGKLLSNFDAVSVREDSGVDICRKYFNSEAIQVLDPTMLLTKDDYMGLLPSDNQQKGNVLSYYYLDETPEKMEFVHTACKMLGLSQHRINTKTENNNARLSDRIAPSIQEWLNGFISSDLVIVDSFHAMVFAILFNVPFIVIGNESRGLSRFTSLLNKLGLEERLVINKEESFLEVLSNKIDWITVNSKLQAERERAVNYLTTALQNK